MYVPTFFLIYINQLFEALKQKHPNIAYQAFVDDIIISAKTKQELENRVENSTWNFKFTKHEIKFK